MAVDAIDLMSPEAQACPFPAYRTLRDEAPVYRMPDKGLYLVTRYDDIAEILRRPDIYSVAWGHAFPLFKFDTARRIYADEGWERMTPLSTDPPLHTLYRKLVDVGFTAGRVRRLEGRIRDIIERLIDGFADRSEIEFVEAFCVPLPMTVIADRLGLPQADVPRLKVLSTAWVQPYSLLLDEAGEIDCARLGVELQHYLKAHLEDRRATPRDDILTDIATARYDDTRLLTMTEMLGLAEQILVGGNETTTNALAMAMRLMIERPGLEDRLRGSEDAIRAFVEESLRLESPTQGLYRITKAETELGGVVIPEGAIVHIRFAAANRDERHFPDPDRLDLDRRNAGSHMAFSQAHHHCLGAPLARQEMQLAFLTLLDRFEHWRLAPAAETAAYVPSFALRALASLHVAFDRRG